MSQAVNFPSMARAGAAQGGAAKLAAIKAVDGAYPLRGKIDVRFGPTAPVQSLTHGPAPGTAWIDPALAEALSLKIGDGLELGDTTLRVAALIAIEPDRGTGFAALAPRVMFNVADVAATGLVQPSSRITWRLAVGARRRRARRPRSPTGPRRRSRTRGCAACAWRTCPPAGPR